MDRLRLSTDSKTHNNAVLSGNNKPGKRANWSDNADVNKDSQWRCLFYCLRNSQNGDNHAPTTSFFRVFSVSDVYEHVFSLFYPLTTTQKECCHGN